MRRRVEDSYQCKVAAILPHSDEMMILASSGIFALRYPDHAVAQGLRQIVSQLEA